MRTWLWGALRASLLAVLGSVIGGGFLLWLEANGIDLKRWVAEALQIAQSPEHLLVALLVLSGLIGSVLAALVYLLLALVREWKRPPSSTVRELRAALVGVTEDVFDVLPDGGRANAAIGRLRASVFELAPYNDLMAHVRNILALADSYVAGTIASEYGSSDEQAAETAALHDDALKEIRAVLKATNWVVANRDELV